MQTLNTSKITGMFEDKNLKQIHVCVNHTSKIKIKTIYLR